MSVTLTPAVESVHSVPVLEVSPDSLTENHPLLRKPPAANRGVIPQDPRRELIPAIDYYTGVLPGGTYEQFCEWLEETEEIAGVVWVDKPDRGRSIGTWYPNHMSTEDGSLFCYRQNEKNPDLLDFVVQLSGTACRRAGTSAIAGFNRLVYEHGGHCSRIDPNVDDFLGDLTYEEVKRAAYEKRFTRFRKHHLNDGYDIDSKDGGFTQTFGKRDSDAYVRIYDAYAKHGIPAIRFEAECKGAIAKKIGLMITTCTTDEMLARLLGGILNGMFRITSARRNHNTNRIESAPFWKRFSDRLANPIRVVGPKRSVTIERTIGFVKSVVPKALAKFVAYYGCHWADELKAVIRRGRERFTADDFAALKATKTDGFLRFWTEEGDEVDITSYDDRIENWVDRRGDEWELVPF